MLRIYERRRIRRTVRIPKSQSLGLALQILMTLWSRDNHNLALFRFTPMGLELLGTIMNDGLVINNDGCCTTHGTSWLFQKRHCSSLEGYGLHGYHSLSRKRFRSSSHLLVVYECFNIYLVRSVIISTAMAALSSSSLSIVQIHPDPMAPLSSHTPFVTLSTSH